MNRIIRPLRWWDMVSPQGEQEMIPFLRTYIGKATGWRTPKRKWQDLWMLNRGDMNHIMGMRKFGSISNYFTGPKYQKGMIAIAAAVYDGGGTEPELTDIDYSKTAATGAQRVHVAYDSDGSIVWGEGGVIGGLTYADLTTQDGGSHSTEWWPDKPETNEGLNWDIRYTNLTNSFDFHFRTTVTTPADRAEDSWFVLDDVSNDYADATNQGALVITAVGKGSSSDTGITDVEIRVTTSGSAIASHNVDTTVTKIT